MFVCLLGWFGDVWLFILKIIKWGIFRDFEMLRFVEDFEWLEFLCDGVVCEFGVWINLLGG